MLECLKSEPQNGAQPDFAVMFLHGYGSNAEDLMSLQPFFAEFLPNAAFIAPNAPIDLEMLNSHAWFDIENRAQDHLLKGVDFALSTLEPFINEQLKELGLAKDRLILVGFSQGAMLSLSYGLMQEAENKPFAVLAFSGCLIGDESHWQNHMKQGNHNIFLSHGEIDDVVPFESHLQTKEILENLEIHPICESSENCGHWIDESALIAAKNLIMNHT